MNCSDWWHPTSFRYSSTTLKCGIYSHFTIIWKNNYSLSQPRPSKSVLELVMWGLFHFENLHEMVGRATPEKLMIYKLSLQLYKTYNQHIPTQDWVNLNFNGIFTSRQSRFITRKENKQKIGMNSISNRFFLIWMEELNWTAWTFRITLIN